MTTCNASQIRDKICINNLEGVRGSDNKIVQIMNLRRVFEFGTLVFVCQ